MIESRPVPDVSVVLAQGRRELVRAVTAGAGCVLLVGVALAYAGALDHRRYADAFPIMIRLGADAMPPDFRRWQSWGTPLLETLAMSVGGTALAVVAALPLGALSARNLNRQRAVGTGARLLLNLLRSIPELVWGILFVAAVGFGPLPGVLALGVHSTGMLGKFFSETFEHVAQGPGDALRSQGVSSLGVLRFAVLPQVLPRLVDVSVYRWEHNLRSATTVGMVGAGGLGLEIITAFQVFEYREASALLLLLLGLVTTISALGAVIRSRYVGHKMLGDS